MMVMMVNGYETEWTTTENLRLPAHSKSVSQSPSLILHGPMCDGSDYDGSDGYDC